MRSDCASLFRAHPPFSLDFRRLSHEPLNNATRPLFERDVARVAKVQQQSLGEADGDGVADVTKPSAPVAPARPVPAYDPMEGGELTF